MATSTVAVVFKAALLNTTIRLHFLYSKMLSVTKIKINAVKCLLQ